MRLWQALRNQSAKIAANLEDSKLFTQMGDRGRFREAIIRDFLRPFLPDCFGLASGEVFASDGSQSAQVDIIVYDSVFSTVLFKSGPDQLFPAESIFGSIEVKSNLSMSELDTACGNISSVKRLNRAPSTMLDFLPFLRFRVSDEFAYDTRPANPYVGFVFGYRGAMVDAVLNDLNGRLATQPEGGHLLPDFVFVAQPGYTVLKVNASGSPVAPGKEFDRFAYLNTRSDTLPLFFVTLSVFLQQIRLRAYDPMLLWRQIAFPEPWQHP